MRSALINAALAFVVLLLAGPTLRNTLSLSDLFILKALVGYGLAVALLVGFLPAHRPHPRLGPANQVTLLRALLTAFLLGLVGEGDGAAIAWTAFLLALFAESLDGVDGWLARRGGWASPFGARFDMETDALLVAVLALLVWSLDKAGIWVLAAGLLRYLFVAAGILLPWMRRPLPPSRRRQTACVVQVLTLTLALLPALPPDWSALVAGAGLILLCYSFGVDTLWLARRASFATGTGEYQ
jgi:phosphatidylglycerophosphate synthase